MGMLCLVGVLLLRYLNISVLYVVEENTCGDGVKVGNWVIYGIKYEMNNNRFDDNTCRIWLTYGDVDDDYELVKDNNKVINLVIKEKMYQGGENDLGGCLGNALIPGDITDFGKIHET